MTVRELIEALKLENQDAIVVYRDDGDYYLASEVFRCQVDRKPLFRPTSATERSSK